MQIFTTTASDPGSSARTGEMVLPHGKVETPVFMPVGTNASVKAISHESLESMDIGLILGNTYHLYLRPGLEVIRHAGGLHKFMGWNGNVLTDSGGFQIFSLANLRKITAEGAKFQSHIDGSTHQFTPENVIDAQQAFGSDIAMPLDVCTPPGISHKEAEDALHTTIHWLKRSASTWCERPDTWNGSLFGIVQGNFYPDLRRQSAELTIAMNLPGIAIGGLSVGESFETFTELLECTAEFLPHDIPRYLMGIGTPDYILTAIEHGIDMFDCVFPTRTARNGLVFSRNGPVNLKKAVNEYLFEPIDPDCSCTACTRYTRAYLRHLFKAKEIFGIMLATEHNIRFLIDLVKNARIAIANKRFFEFKRSTLAEYQRKSSAG